MKLSDSSRTVSLTFISGSDTSRCPGSIPVTDIFGF